MSPQKFNNLKKFCVEADDSQRIPVTWVLDYIQVPTYHITYKFLGGLVFT